MHIEVHHNMLKIYGGLVRIILECIGKPSFSYECKNECICYQNIIMFFVDSFYLIKNNEYKSVVFTILEGLKHSSMRMHMVQTSYNVWYF